MTLDTPEGDAYHGKRLGAGRALTRVSSFELRSQTHQGIDLQIGGNTVRHGKANPSGHRRYLSLETTRNAKPHGLLESEGGPLARIFLFSAITSDPPMERKHS